jgi:TATA-box binding protein (TBP) (component of TFIID and TFIIIB)
MRLLYDPCLHVPRRPYAPGEANLMGLVKARETRRRRALLHAKRKVEADEKGRIVNVVGIAWLPHYINLIAASALWGFRWSRRHGVPYTNWRLIHRHGKMTFWIYPSSIICFNAKSPRQAMIAMRRLILKLQTGGVQIKGTPIFKVLNLVSHHKLGCSINLEEASTLLDHAIYDPEGGMVSAAIWQPEPGSSALIFANGEIMITAPNHEKRRQLLKKLLDKLALNELMEAEAKAKIEM